MALREHKETTSQPHRKGVKSVPLLMGWHGSPHFASDAYNREWAIAVSLGRLPELGA